MSRPFFSVIISCYNSRKVIKPMLNSLVDQHLSKDELEVIISDDCSTEPYDDIVAEYYDKLNIVWTKTEYNYCPANTRQAGAEKATGIWMTFADHDDVFLPDSLRLVRNTINAHNTYCYHIFAVYRCDRTTLKLEHSINYNSILTHAKFIHKDRLWDKYNLHYPKDLTCHEDMYMVVMIEKCLLHAIHHNWHLTVFPVYIWYDNALSLGKRQLYLMAQDHKHDIILYRDYIRSCGQPALECYEEHLDESYKQLILAISCACLFGCYFAIKRTEYYQPEWDMTPFRELSIQYIKRIEDTLQYGDKQIIGFMREGFYQWKIVQTNAVQEFKNFYPKNTRHKKPGTLIQNATLDDFIDWYKDLKEEYKDVDMQSLSDYMDLRVDKELIHSMTLKDVY